MTFSGTLKPFRRRRILAIFILLHRVTVIYASDNISCHYSDVGDELPSSEDGFIPKAPSIFFHETSCKQGFTARQACSVESASRAHPNWTIYVFFLAPMAKEYFEQSALAVVRRLPNVKFRRIHIQKYAQGTPLAALVEGGALNRSQWKIVHTSDVVRILTLFKWPGVYLDLDVVVNKSLDSLAKNWAGFEDEMTVGNSVLSFSGDKIGRKVADAAISQLETNYRGDLWNHNGPAMMTRVLQKLCTAEVATAMSAKTCEGFEVYRTKFFYPVPWEERRKYYDPGELNASDAYIYHVWNSGTKNYAVHKDSPYAKLARKYCPKAYDYAREEF